MYDFTSMISRRNTDSVKWDVKPNELPMWVADMDFKAAPEILEAMRQKVDFGIFGYEEPHDDYFEAVAKWYQREHHANIEKDWMFFSTGVVPTISSAVRRVTNVGDNVLVQAPVYNIFYNSIVNNGRHVLSSDLVYDVKTHQYHIDWQDLDAKLAEPLTTMMILCNPHNPIGKVWTKEDLMKINRLCLKHSVTLLADEIHGDLVFKGADYTPMFSLPEELLQNVIVAVSPSKTFNLAVLHAATVIVPNEALRSKVNRGINTDELGEPNLLAIPGTIAAYTRAGQWVHELRGQIRANYETVVKFCQESIAGITVVPSTATYLVWIDVRQLTDDSAKLATFIRAKTGLYLSAGNVYGGDGNHFLRLNIASPKAMVEDGLNRLQQGIKEFSAIN